MAYKDKSRDEEGNEPAEPEGDEDTFLVPKSALYGKELEPGDRETIEVVSVMDDEVEVRCVGKKEKSDTPDMDRADSDLDALATPIEA